ncbi:MAG TPA: His/Gly/Thr/Pro-type tRNA ligase C-terminal domain-containing protein, partial [Chitinophagales bacterium]|nr:His/Gly/Thr/Pro-type tRNA ligase C-terminal domain-containing protein [Chitinophagales bacterium]
EKIGKKIRDAETRKIPYMLIVGEKEAENGTVSVRKHGAGDQGSVTAEQFIEQINLEIEPIFS